MRHYKGIKGRGKIMKKMKRNLLLGASIVTALAISGCGDAEKNENLDDSTQDSEIAVETTQEIVQEPVEEFPEEILEETTGEDVITMHEAEDGSVWFSDAYWGDILVGNKVLFGRYEQDGDLENGPEPIEWEIIVDDYRRSYSKGEQWMLLVSTKALDSKVYHDKLEEGITWENCWLQSWLNDDFYNSAFDEDEKKKLVDYRRDDYSENVSMLDIDVLMFADGDYSTGTINASSKFIVEPTQYAIDQGVVYSELTEDKFEEYGLADYNYVKENVVGRLGAWCWLQHCNSENMTATGINQDGIWSQEGEIRDKMNEAGGGVVPVIIVRYGEGFFLD